jgi:alkylated DNA repair dioxygenase AlkB
MLQFPNAQLYFQSDFLSIEESNELYQYLIKAMPWENQQITLFGKTFPCPRLEAFFATDGLTYGYSGNRLTTNTFTPVLAALKKRVEEKAGTSFNAVLVNYYRDGNDSNGWHADNEKELGKNPIIASLSLGETRRFDLKHTTLGIKHQFQLSAGSLLIMAGETQHFWKHQLPKSKKVTSGRINLTFRKIV